MNEVKEIPFNGNTLLGVKTPDGLIWLAIKKACLDIGLNENQARTEIKKIQEALLFKNECKKLSVKFHTQVRETLFLQEKFVPMWLAQINLTPAMQKKNPDAVQKLLKYQLEAAEVLHKAFYESEEQKSTFNDRMGLDGRIEIMTVQINNMESILEEQREDLKSVMDNMTLTTVQQGKLQRAVKDRVGYLLGGAHSPKYKENSRTYFINLWNALKERFDCGSRWQDLNPKYFNQAYDYVSEWDYVE